MPDFGEKVHVLDAISSLCEPRMLFIGQALYGAFFCEGVFRFSVQSRESNVQSPFGCGSAALYYYRVNSFFFAKMFWRVRGKSFS